MLLVIINRSIKIENTVTHSFHSHFNCNTDCLNFDSVWKNAVRRDMVAINFARRLVNDRS